MRQRYALQLSAIVVVATGSLFGCANSPNNSGPNAGAGTGGLPPTSPIAMMTPGVVGAPPAGTAGTGTTGPAVMPPMTGMTTPPTTVPMAGAGTAGAASGGMGGAAAGSGGSDPMMGGAGGSTPPAMGSCGPENTIAPADLGDPMKPGPWTPTMEMGGPSGQSTLFYPKDLGKDGVLHPVFHWGCGAGSTPSQYADHLNLLASQGFVVIANASGSMPAKASLDWLLAENEKMGSKFYQKLDPKRVGTGGHSLGALETFQFAADPRLTLYVLVCGGANGGTGAADIHAPSIFLGGEGEGGTANFAGDYAEITKAPSIFVTKTDTDHIYCARNNLAPWVAFMRWNFCGEEKYKKEFMPDGTYCKAPWLACMSKGF